MINKKTVIDKVMSTNALTAAKTNQASGKVVRALNLVQRMFPDLYTTRFHQVSDFYTLVVLISKFYIEGLILTDRRRNRLAQDLLKSLSIGVDELRARQKKLGATHDSSELYRDYLLTGSGRYR